MSNEITAYKIHSAGVLLRGVKRLEGADKDSLVQLLFDIAAHVAEREQSPAADHAMVAKISQLKVISSEMQVSYAEMQQDLADAEANHAAMVAKLRELSNLLQVVESSDEPQTEHDLGYEQASAEISGQLLRILSTEPAMRSANATDAQTEVKK